MLTYAVNIECTKKMSKMSFAEVGPCSHWHQKEVNSDKKNYAKKKKRYDFGFISCVLFSILKSYINVIRI